MDQPIQKHVQEFKEGDFIRGKFAVRSKDTPKEYRNKPGKYFFLGIGDKTGDISLKYWGRADERPVEELYNSLSVGDVIELMGQVEVDKFDNMLSVSVDEGLHPVRKCGEDEFDAREFLPVAERDIGDMMEELHAIIGSVEEPHLAGLLSSFFSDEDFVRSFRESPAAMMHHHSYLGGLLEHTLNVVKLCDSMSKHYPKLDRELLICGAVLHDIGKIDAYQAQTSIDMTDSGKFLGHISMSISMFEEKLKDTGAFPGILKMKLYHLILSHHGNIESGAESRPKGLKIPEAAVLYYADLLDSKVAGFLQEMDKDKTIEDDWVYLRGVGSEVYMK
ncbi:MAG: HD domain-containing protein [Thermoplasmata archaeon]|nr:MAG: HD domain-containing protein [Thermoplasmata archaeon]